MALDGQAVAFSAVNRGLDGWTSSLHRVKCNRPHTRLAIPSLCMALEWKGLS